MITLPDLITQLTTHTLALPTVLADPEACGFRFYRLRRHPWRHINHIDTLLGTVFAPATYDGDYAMVFPRTPHPRHDYYDLFFARIPGNLASLGYDELRSLTPLTRFGYRRIAWTALPPRWRTAFHHEITAALTLSCSA